MESADLGGATSSKSGGDSEEKSLLKVGKMSSLEGKLEDGGFSSRMNLAAWVRLRL